MRTFVFIAGVLLGVSAAGFWPSRASACGCSPSPLIYRSDPIEGAVDVPLNQVLMIETNGGTNGVTFAEQSGRAVAFELNYPPGAICSRWAELVPHEPLSPYTTYVVQFELPLRQEGVERSSLTFTTGSSMLPKPTLATPNGRVSLVESIPFNSCATQVVACIALDDAESAEDVEVIARRGGEVVMRSMLRNDNGHFEFIFAPDCLEFRRRGRTGERSAPLTFCGDALRRHTSREADFDRTGIGCKRELVDVPDDSTPKPPVLEPSDSGAGEESFGHDGAPVPGMHELDHADAGSHTRMADRPNAGCSITRGSQSGAASAVVLWCFALALHVVRRGRRAV